MTFDWIPHYGFLDGSHAHGLGTRRVSRLDDFGKLKKIKNRVNNRVLGKGSHIFDPILPTNSYKLLGRELDPSEDDPPSEPPTIACGSPARLRGHSRTRPILSYGVWGEGERGVLQE